MKKTLIFYIVTQFCLLDVCSSQAYKYVYYFDREFNSVGKSKAILIGRGVKEDELFRLDCFTKQDAILVLSAHYVDSSLKKLQGEYTAFFLNGKTEIQGNYLNDKMQGLWERWDTLGHKIDSTLYHDDKALTVAIFNYYENGRLSSYSFKDSLADTFISTFYNEKGVITGEAAFKGQRGLLKSYDSGSVKLDSLYTREGQEAFFPGGQRAWVRYLQKNLDPNIPVRNGAPLGTYQVIVKFIVSKDGTISDVTAETHYGYGMEMEVVRLIQKGPKWEPASQYGRKINAYRRQPITFLVGNK